MQPSLCLHVRRMLGSLHYSPFAACGLCEKNIIDENQKQYILEVTIIIALFSVSTNQISLRKITKKRENKRRQIEL